MKRKYGKRLSALCLSAALLSVYLPLAAAQEPAAYTGTVLMALNTDRGDNDADFTTDRVLTGEPVEAAAAQAEDGMLPDALPDDPQPLSPAQAMRREAEVGHVEPQAAASYRVGDAKTISSHYAVSENAEYRYVDMVCTSVGETATVWRESGTENDHAEDDRKLAAELDERLPKELEFFGDKRIDTDGDGKIAVFLYEIDGINIGGYFTVVDLMDKYGRVGPVWHPYTSASNHMDCIHVQGGSSYSFIVDTCLHEYQHYIQASYRFVGRNNFTVLDAAETFVNEGFSTAAEFLLYGVDRYSYLFADATKPSGGLSFMNWEHDNGNYSMAFVFSQYIRTRYAAMTNDLGGDVPGGTIYKKILESRTPKNDDDTFALIADILYPASEYPELRDSAARCRRLLTDFWTAVYCQQPEGVHGFNGESWASRIDVREMIEPMPAGKTQYPIRSGMAAFYQITTNDTDTVRITQSDKALTFAAPPQRGYTLRFDANGGVHAPQAVILANSYTFRGRYDREIPMRSGYTFMGWALTADASSAQYNAGSSLALTADTTLYAVWQPAAVAVTDTAYPMSRQGREYRNTYRFVPETDGIYKLIYSDRSDRSMSVLLGGKTVDCIYAIADSGTVTAYYRLKGAAAYDLHLDMVGSWNSTDTFRIVRQDTCYNLTYRFDHPLVAQTWSYACDTDYIAEAPEAPVMPCFLGWAYTKDAQAPDVLPGDKVTLTEDTTLYAVCAPETVLTTDGVPVRTETYADTFLYILQPQQDGMYTLHWDRQSADDYGYIGLLDAQGSPLLDVRPDDDVSCALRKGRTYYLYGVTDASHELVTCRKTADRISTTLMYFVGDGAWFDLTVHGGTEYTVPDYTPVSLDGRRFAGWRAGEDNDYLPGDTITVASDSIIMAQWSDETEVTAADRLLLPARAIRALWQWIGLRVADRLG